MLAATATVAAQVHDPSRDLEAQQDIIGSLQVGDGARAEHERTHTIARDVTLDALKIVLHRGASHLTAHEGLATGAPQFVERHATPVIGCIRCHNGQRCLLRIGRRI